MSNDTQIAAHMALVTNLAHVVAQNLPHDRAYAAVEASARQLAEQPKEISWVDEQGTCHRMSIEGATKLLARFWEEWPGGWPEVEAEKEARKKT